MPCPFGYDLGRLGLSPRALGLPMARRWFAYLALQLLANGIEAVPNCRIHVLVCMSLSRRACRADPVTGEPQIDRHAVERPLFMMSVRSFDGNAAEGDSGMIAE